jgi:peptidyl-prolyl cis-trans isomerase D
MAIIGRIRKHSGLAVIIVGVAIAAFVIGDFGKKRSRGSNDIGSVNGEAIPYTEFNSKVDQTLTIQKENSKNEKVTDEDTYNIRQTTWTIMVRDLLMGKEYEKLGLVVSPEELFDQVQGKTPHRLILQYFKDPKTGMYDPALVINYLKNLDQMEPKAKEQWLRFEKAIKEDRYQTKFNNLIGKGYYMPKAFLKKQYMNQAKTLKIRFVAPSIQEIPDAQVKLTDADYQHYYDEYKAFFEQDEPLRILDYVIFEVNPSATDQKKISDDVQSIYRDFLTSNDLPNYINANSDKKYDSLYQKKGQLQGKIDSLAFELPVGTIIPVYEDNKSWYMAKILDRQERPDSMKASQILISWEGTKVSESVKRTKEQAKAKADSLLAFLKKFPERFTELARTVSDYPTAKDDAGDLKWFLDGIPNYWIFFKAGLDMKPNDIKVVETAIGYSVFKLTDKSKPVEKVQVALLQRQIVPSNQTYQDTYLKASAFAGQNKTPDAFNKAAEKLGLPKRSDQTVKQMDNFVSGLQSAREVVRWAFAETTKIGEVSPVFDVSGKYVVAVLKDIIDKGVMPLEKVKGRIEPSVRNEAKVKLLTEKMQKGYLTMKNIYDLSAYLKAKVDTTNLTFAGYSRSMLARENAVVGETFTLRKGNVYGPLEGKFGSYFVQVDDIVEPPAREDFSYEQRMLSNNYASKVENRGFEALKKTAVIKDDRIRFY